jgi:hypothetical protein
MSTYSELINSAICCQNCGYAPEDHDPEGQCLFAAKCTYVGKNPSLTWDFWKMLKQYNQTNEEIQKVNDLIKEVGLHFPSDPWAFPGNPRYDDRTSYYLHRVAMRITNI